MTPVEIAYGERYADDSGWSRRLCIDTHSGVVEIDALGAHVAIQIDDLWWLVRAAMLARVALGVAIIPGEPEPAQVTVAGEHPNG